MKKLMKLMAAMALIVSMVGLTNCTKQQLAEIETSNATAVTSNSASVGGVVLSEGGSTVLERGVCWSTRANPDVRDNHLTSGGGPGSFVCNLKNLTPVTTYYVRAYAINSVGVSYGMQITFTTLTGNGGGGGNDDDDPEGAPVVTTGEVTNITATSAKVNGNVISNGTSSVTDRGICWGTNHNPTMNEGLVSCGTGTGSFVAELTNLVLGTTYYARAYATNASGTAYGDEVSFVTVAPGGVPVGAISGVFNAGQRFVYFSKGNLQYQPSSNTWRFAEHQYDIIGSQNQYVSTYYNGWIDLFCWGTSGYNHGAAHYEPWSTTTNDADYNAYGNVNYNLSDQTGQADWGYNAISNGGNSTNIWNTLSKDEWVYIFNARYTESNIRYAKATINEIAGIILLPDDWNPSTFALYNTNEPTSYWANYLTTSDWEILENAGAVFLPCAGYRSGTYVYEYSTNNNYGEARYWSSTAYSEGSAHYVWCNYDSYYGGHLNPQNYMNRSCGLSVRLVQTVNR